MERSEVYAIIDSERDYQDYKFGQTLSSNKPGNGERTIDEFCLYIQGYANMLGHIGATCPDPKEKLSYIRKVAGLCVVAMEQHGGEPRVIPEPAIGTLI